MTETLLKFPCQFPIKIFTKKSDKIVDCVLKIVKQYAPNMSEKDITTTESKNGQYLAMTATVNATSKDQLDNIYRALTQDDNIIMTL